MFVKTVKRKNYWGGEDIYHYLALNYREEGKIKVKTFGRLNLDEVEEVNQGHTPERLQPFVDKWVNELRGEVSPQSRETSKSTSTSEQDLISPQRRETSQVLIRLQALIDHIMEKAPPFDKAYRPQKFAQEYLIPLLSASE